MQVGAVISAAGHVALIALAVWGLPWFEPRDRDAIRVTEVSFISPAEFEAAQAAASAEASRAPDAPAEQPAAATPIPQTSPSRPLPEVVRGPTAPSAPEAPDTPETPSLAPRFDPASPLTAAPEIAAISPRVVTPGPPTAATAPRPRPAERVAPDAPPSPEVSRPAEAPTPVPVPQPVTEPTPVEPSPPEEASPEPAAEPAPEAQLALTTSAPPLPRRGNMAPRPEPVAEAAPAPTPAPGRASNQTVERDAIARAVAEAAAAGATPPTPPTPPSQSQAAATSLPVGPPLTQGERDGLRLAVQRCWNMPAGVRDAQELRVVVAAELSVDGAVINSSIRLVEPNPAPDPRFQQAFEAGRRALIRCSPYDSMPREKFAQWRNIEVVFNPEGMVSW